MKKRNIIGQRVKLARKRAILRITQKDLTARLQLGGLRIERVTISRIESGARGVSDVEVAAIAKALGVTISWLFGDEP